MIWEAAQRLLGGKAHAVEATPRPSSSSPARSWSIFSAPARSAASPRRRRARRSRPTRCISAPICGRRSRCWSGFAPSRLGYPWADAAAAIVVAVFICIAGWRLGRRTIDTLTDTAPEGVSERVAAIARQASGVVAVERVRARPAGAVLFVDLAVGVSRTLPLDRVSAHQGSARRAPSAPSCRPPKSPSPPSRARSTTRRCASA